MSKFKVGDRVVFRVAADVDVKGFPHNGHEATVIDLGGAIDYKIKFDDGAALPVRESELSPAPQDESPREIAFEDIKKGDDIEARYTRDGVAYTRRGVAHSTYPHPRPKYWQTEALGVIADNYYGEWQHYLHSRPVPEEPKGLGAVIRQGASEFIATNREPGTRRWVWVFDNRVGPQTDLARWDEFDPDTIEVLSEDDLTKEEANE